MTVKPYIQMVEKRLLVLLRIASDQDEPMNPRAFVALVSG